MQTNMKPIFEGQEACFFGSFRSQLLKILPINCHFHCQNKPQRLF